jgi:serine/threonine protein kinase
VQTHFLIVDANLIPQTKTSSQLKEVEVEAKDWNATANERVWAVRKEGIGSGQRAEGEAEPSVMVWEVQIIQEFCDHGSLRSVLSDKTFLKRNGHLDAGVMLKLAGDVARGMLHIHSMQIVHGDLKALNILVTGESSLTAKVADFGLSVRMEHDQTHVSGMHAGTLTHMAPEILMSGHLSKAADVYAFGILMYEVQTKQKAFKGVPMHQLTSDVCSKMRRPVFPPEAPIKVG